MTPEISVVVGAHRLRPYLRHALDSLAAQTLHRDRFEVVVVTGFDDAATEEAIRRHGFRSARMATPDEALGAMVARGVRLTSGRIVAFLEDDDLYTAGRLEAVAEAFDHDPTLAYYSNGYLDIDPQGRTVGPGVGTDPTRPPIYLRAEPRSLTEVRRTVAQAHPGSTSNTAIRRSALERSLPALESVRVGNDQCLFLTGLASGGAMLFDPRCLTLYRVHEGQSGQRHPELTREYIAFKEWRAQRGLEDALAFRAGVAGPLAVGAREYLEANIAIRSLETAVFAPSLDRRRVARCLPSVLRAAIRFRSSWYTLRWGWGVAALFAPGISHRYDHSRDLRAQRLYEERRAAGRDHG